MQRVLPLLLLASCVTTLDDPAPGFSISIKESRRLVCESTTLEAMRTAHPGLLEDARPRGDYADRRAMECNEVIFGEDEQRPRDRAVLGTLNATTHAIARQVATTSPRRVWLVESHYPDAQVASKIAFATKTALAEHGLNVSDRIPPLAVGDIDVISRMPPPRAHAVACRRYFADGKLGDGDAVLGVGLLDRRETDLHAGTCIDGRWTWLR